MQLQFLNFRALRVTQQLSGGNFADPNFVQIFSFSTVVLRFRAEFASDHSVRTSDLWPTRVHPLISKTLKLQISSNSAIYSMSMTFELIFDSYTYFAILFSLIPFSLPSPSPSPYSTVLR